MKTFRELMSEVAQPKPKDEIDFKAKHEIEMIDHPESEEHQHTSEKRGRKRLADYTKGQDMSVYEAKHDHDDDVEENAFVAKAAAAKKAGKDKFKLGDKKFPVTIKKDTADKIVEAKASRDFRMFAMAAERVGKDLVQLANDINRLDGITKQDVTKAFDEIKTKFNKLGVDSRRLSESVDLAENFKQGSLTLKDGSKVIVSKQNADLLNQMFKDLNATNRREMMKVAMEDKAGFEEILGFAREAL